MYDAIQIHRKDLPPSVEGIIGEGSLVADADGGVVDQNVQSAEVRLQFLDHAFHGGPVTYVGVERQRSSPCRCDGCAGGICARPVGVVVDTHVCSGGCKRDCDCLTDPLGSAGN